MMFLLYAVHILICIFLILVVLLQQGKGADLSVFGGGSSMAAFGARSGTTLLHRLTVGAFVAFILTTLGIAYAQATRHGTTVMGAEQSAPTSQGAPAPAAPATPATPAPSAPAAPATPPPAQPPAPQK
jgi:preprotein translocase subunit SecG